MDLPMRDFTKMGRRIQKENMFGMMDLFTMEIGSRTK